MHFYYRDYNDSHWFGQQVTEHFSNAFECGLYKKSHLKQAGGQITFNHREQVAVSLKLAKSFWDNEATLSLVGHDENTMKITKPINVPDLEANLSVDVAVLPQMKVNLEYELQSGRYGLAPNFSVLSTFSGEPWLKREKMKDIHNVTLRGNYVFNKSFSIYVQMSNLLNQKYDYWYTYPEQGIGAVGGFTFVF